MWEKVVNVVKSGKSRQKVVIEVKRMCSNSMWSKVVESKQKLVIKVKEVKGG